MTEYRTPQIKVGLRGPFERFAVHVQYKLMAAPNAIDFTYSEIVPGSIQRRSALLKQAGALLQLRDGFLQILISGPLDQRICGGARLLGLRAAIGAWKCRFLPLDLGVGFGLPQDCRPRQ